MPGASCITADLLLNFPTEFVDLLRRRSLSLLGGILLRFESLRETVGLGLEINDLGLIFLNSELCGTVNRLLMLPAMSFTYCAVLSWPLFMDSISARSSSCHVTSVRSAKLSEY